MLIFFFIVSIYCLANFYTFLKLSAIINSGIFLDIMTGVVVLFMTLSPVLLVIYSHKGSERSVKTYAYATYMWLGLLVIFFPAALVLDAYNLILEYIAAVINRDLSPSSLSLQQTFYVPLAVATAANIYGLYEAGNLCIERFTLRTSKLPEGADRIRVVQISDLHLGFTVGEKILDDVINKISGIKPDIIVSTGDLVDGTVHYIRHFSEKLNKLEARLGKYAVTGNHEVYGGLKHTVRFIENSGFRLLRETGVTVENMINIAGMDFSGGEVSSYKLNKPEREEWEILSDLPRDKFTLLLKHRSDVQGKSLGLFDLQLSGHTHKGQIFPINLATMFIFQHHNGFKKLAENSSLYVSRGTGTAGPPVRFLSKPEITVFDIVPDEKCKHLQIRDDE